MTKEFKPGAIKNVEGKSQSAVDINLEKALEGRNPEEVRSLKEEDERGRKAAEELKKLQNKQKGSTDELIEHDLTAENGPHGAQKHDPKPPYWGQSVEAAQAEWPKDGSEMTEDEKKGSPVDPKRENSHDERPQLGKK